MSTIINLGKVVPTYKGEWNSTTVYNKLDWVLVNGSGYLSLQDNAPLGTSPELVPAIWVPYGLKGADGINGTNGINGPKGDTGAEGPEGPKGDTGEPGPPVAITSDWEQNDPTVALSSAGGFELNAKIEAAGGESSTILGRLNDIEDVNTIQNTNISNLASDLGALNNKVVSADTTVEGLVRIATTAEVTAGTSDSVALTPLKVKAIKDAVEDAVEHGQIGANAIVLTTSTDINTVTEAGTYYLNGSVGHTNLPDGWSSTDKCMLYIDKVGSEGNRRIHNRLNNQFAIQSISPVGSVVPWKIISDGSQGMPSDRSLNISSTLRNNDSTYTALANGSIVFQVTLTGTDEYWGMSRNGMNVVRVKGNGLERQVQGEVFVSKGQTLEVACYPTVPTSMNTFFVYAEGN